MMHPNSMKLLFTTLFIHLSIISHACLIVVLRDRERMLVGNHEDWYEDDTAIRFIPGQEGQYASIVFTFQNEGWAQGGMNEHGLFFDGVRTPYDEVEFGDKKPYAEYIWQKVLDKCKNVEEAVAFINHYALPELEETHIILADASGNTALVGVKNGKPFIHQTNQNLIQTNFNPWHPELDTQGECPRYATAQNIIKADASASEEVVLNILKNTHQDSLSVYSNIYDLKARKITIIDKLKFDERITISFDDMRNADCMIPLDQFVKNKKTLCSSNKLINNKLIIKGQTLSLADSSPIPFVNIGIENLNQGTLSDPDGSFEILLDTRFVHDTLTFSSIGYERRYIPIMDLISGDAEIITMNEEALLLDEIVINEKQKFKKDRIGYMGGDDGILPWDTLQGGGVVAMLVESPGSGFFVDKFQFRLMYNSKDTIRFRMHFYAYDSVKDQPGEELLRKEVILEKVDQEFGWVRFDLRDREIFIPGTHVFVGLEWIDDRATRKKLRQSLEDWGQWRYDQFMAGNENVKKIDAVDPTGKPYSYYKYYGNMMKWEGWKLMPPFTGLMVETGKTPETAQLRTFERRTSMGTWVEKDMTLNAVLAIRY